MSQPLSMDLPVSRIPLADFVRTHTQAKAGELLGGLSQAAISKMLRKGRSVFVEAKPDGGFVAIEEKVVSRNTDAGEGAD